MITQRRPGMYRSMNTSQMGARNTTLSTAMRQRFDPVSEDWQIKKAKELGLEWDSSLEYRGRSQVIFTEESLPCRTLDIKADGNCFFRAISVVITGIEMYHSEIREAVTKHMSKDVNLYRTFMQSRGGEDRYIRNMRQPREWATEVEIFATATWLKTVISVFSDKTGNTWQTFRPLDNEKLDGPVIYLCNEHHHFEPVLEIQNPVDTTTDHSTDEDGDRLDNTQDRFGSRERLSPGSPGRPGSQERLENSYRSRMPISRRTLNDPRSGAQSLREPPPDYDRDRGIPKARSLYTPRPSYPPPLRAQNVRYINPPWGEF